MKNLACYRFISAISNEELSLLSLVEYQLLFNTGLSATLIGSRWLIQRCPKAPVHRSVLIHRSAFLFIAAFSARHNQCHWISTTASIDQLTRLPAEILRLHLSSRHLVTSGNKSMMAQRLYHALHNAENSSFVVATYAHLINIVSNGAICAIATIPPPTSSTQPIMSTSAALPTILPSAVTSEASFPPELQSQLSTLMSQLIQQATAAVANQIAHTTSNSLPASIPGAPPVNQIQ